MSTEAALIPVFWGGKPWLIRVSIVERDVPCLLSKRVLATSGAIVNLADVKMTFKSHESAEVIKELDTGHIAIDLLPRGEHAEDTWSPVAFAEGEKGTERVAIEKVSTSMAASAQFPPLPPPKAGRVPPLTAEPWPPRRSPPEQVVSGIAALGDLRSDEGSASASSENGRVLLNKKTRKKVHRPRDEPLFSVCAPRWRERAQAFALSRSRKPRFCASIMLPATRTSAISPRIFAQWRITTLAMLLEKTRAALTTARGAPETSIWKMKKKICSMFLVRSLASSITKRASSRCWNFARSFASSASELVSNKIPRPNFQKGSEK